MTDAFYPGDENLVFRLPEAFDLEVRVVQGDEKGDVVADARLTVRPRMVLNALADRGAAAAAIRANPAAEGVFRVIGLAPGRYELAVTAPDFSPAVHPVRIKDRPLLEVVVLKPGFATEVAVLAGQDREPLPWAEVMVRLEPEAEPRKATKNETTRSSIQALGYGGSATEVYSGGEGDWFGDTLSFVRHRTGSSGRARFESLPPGRHTFVVTHPGYAVTRGVLEVPAEEAAVVVMQPGGTIEGTVLSRGSGHAPPFMAILEHREGDDLPAADLPRLAVTDLEGRFRMAGLNPGRWSVTIQKRLDEQTPMNLYRTLSQDLVFWVQMHVTVRSGETTRVEIPLDGTAEEERGAVAGRILLDGRAPEGAWIEIQARSKTLTASVGAGGGYRLDEVPAGERTIRVMIPKGAAGQPGYEMRRDVVVEQGLTSLEDFMIETGTVTGRLVRCPEEAPVAGVEVEIWGAVSEPGLAEQLLRSEKDIDGSAALGSAVTSAFSEPVRMSAATDSSGRFSFARLPAGAYNLGTAGSKVEGECEVKSVIVLPGATVGPVTLTIYPPVTASGTVKLPEDLGPGMYMLLVAPADEVAPHHSQTIDFKNGMIRIGTNRLVRIDMQTGAFVIHGITPGSYEAHLYNAADEPGQPRRYKAMPFSVPPPGVTGLVLVPEEEEPGADQ
jgi:hypothetical protein